MAPAFLRSQCGNACVAVACRQRRDLSFSGSAALSKETEEQMLYAEMRDDVLQQLLRRLANVKLR